MILCKQLEVKSSSATNRSKLDMHQCYWLLTRSSVFHKQCITGTLGPSRVLRILLCLFPPYFHLIKIKRGRETKKQSKTTYCIFMYSDENIFFNIISNVTKSSLKISIFSSIWDLVIRKVNSVSKTLVQHVVHEMVVNLQLFCLSFFNRR